MEVIILSILGVIFVAFIILEVVFGVDTVAGRFIKKLTSNHPEADSRDDTVQKDEK